MATYVGTTRFAALQLLNVLANTNNTLVEIDQRLRGIEDFKRQLDECRQRLDAAREPKGCHNPEQHAATVATLEQKLQEHQDSFESSDRRIQELRQVVAFNNLSADALRMSVLQIAKQGISTVYSNLAACPNGRNIGSQPLKNIIWYARNQAIHHEDGTYNPATAACFAALTKEFDDRFCLTKHATENLAGPVFTLLGWTDYPAYEADIKSLLEP
jgi:hypothetical protein